VKQINSKNGDAVIYKSIMGENLCLFLTLLLAGDFFFLFAFLSVFVFLFFIRCGFFLVFQIIFEQRWVELDSSVGLKQQAERQQHAHTQNGERINWRLFLFSNNTGQQPKNAKTVY
jgi:hypothetical protein